MTAWSAVLRVVRHRRVGIEVGRGTPVAVVAAALFTSAATVIIFYERFTDGVWIYAVLVPALAVGFGSIRRQRGDPGPSADRTGRLLARWSAGDLLPLAFDELPPDHEVLPIVERLRGGRPTPDDPSISPVPFSISGSVLHEASPVPAPGPWRVSVPLDGSALSEHALAYVAAIGQQQPIELMLVHVHEAGDVVHANDYLTVVADAMRLHCDSVVVQVLSGEPGRAIVEHSAAHDVAVVVMVTHGRIGLRRAIAGSVAREVVAGAACSVLTVPPPATIRADRALRTR